MSVRLGAVPTSRFSGSTDDRGAADLVLLQAEANNPYGAVVLTGLPLGALGDLASLSGLRAVVVTCTVRHCQAEVDLRSLNAVRLSLYANARQSDGATEGLAAFREPRFVYAAGSPP